MITGLVGVLISLAVLAIVYIVIKWILGYLSLPAPVGLILQIVVGVIAIVIVLRALTGII